MEVDQENSFFFLLVCPSHSPFVNAFSFFVLYHFHLREPISNEILPELFFFYMKSQQHLLTP